MKKRFLNRFTYPYLQKRLPENILPGKGLSSRHVKLLSKGKPLRSSIGSFPPVGGKTPNRSPGLCLRLMRGTLRMHKRKLFAEKHTWWGIDTLEGGSLASASSSPSMIRLGGDSGGSIANQSPGPDHLRASQSDAPTKVWIKRLTDGQLPEQSLLRDAALTSRVETATFSHEGRDSIYSSFQLEEALTKQQERRPSPLLLKLMERNKLRIMYGNIANRELDRLIERGVATRGGLSDNLFRLLESRVDVFLCRVGFFATIPNARQWILHGKVLINNKIVITASHMLKPGDVVSISANNIRALKESLQERSRKCQILKRFAGLAAQAQQAQQAQQALVSTQSGPARPSRGQRSMAWAPPTPFFKEKGIDKASKAGLIRGATSSLLLGNAPGIDFPPSFFKLLGGPRVISGRPARVANDARRERLRWFNVKPSNAEISFRCLTAIYLYPPQQVLLPATVDVERMRRS